MSVGSKPASGFKLKQHNKEEQTVKISWKEVDSPDRTIAKYSSHINANDKYGKKGYK